MPPKSVPPKKDGGPAKPKVNNLPFPAEIRRNYMTRTYSGDNLLKSDLLPPAQKSILKAKVNLMTDNQTHIKSFPELSRLDFRTEMKIFDIVFGEDPLMEGTTTQEHNLQIAKQAKENLENALSLAGKKRLTLKERHTNILKTMQNKIKAVITETNMTVESAIQEFLLLWETQAEQAKEHLLAISIDHVAKIGLDELAVAKRRLKSNIEASLSWIEEFEAKMESIERERAQKLIAGVKDTENQLKDLNYERREIIDSLLLKETEQFNVVLIKNREKIFKFVHNLSMLLSELLSVAQKYCKEADLKWNRLRYAYIAPQFEKEIAAALNADIRGFYHQYQNKFDGFSDIIFKEVFNVLDWKPEEGLKHPLSIWKNNSIRIAHDQDNAISSFVFDLEKLEKNMDKRCSATYSYWLPHIKECKKEGAGEMKGIISKIRKTDEINAGKKASLSLFSKAAKNNFLLLKVMEFITCVSYTTSIFHQVQMLEIEAEVAREQKEIHSKISQDIMALERQFHQILTVIKTETNDATLPSLRLNAKKVLDEIHQKHIERYEECVRQLDSFFEKALVAHGAYRERLSKLFLDDRTREQKNLLDNEDFRSAERDENLFELQYWPIKVEEWRQDQLSILKKMKEEDSIAIEVEKAQAKSIIKKSSKKEGVNEPSSPQNIKVERRDRMTLLDGTLMIDIRDPVKFMEKLSLVSEPYLGQFLEYMEASEEIVNIKVVDGFKVKEARLELQKRVEQDIDVIREIIHKEIKKKIDFKIEQLKGERTRHFADYELANYELDEIVQKRLDQLPKIQDLHENEARFLIDTIKGVRQTYSDQIEIAFKEMDTFSQITLKEIQSVLKNAKNTYDINRTSQKFVLEVEKFNFEFKDMVERANLDFDHAKKMLEKSKQPGNHSSAWIIVKQASGYNPETIGAELEKWRTLIGEDLARAQREISADIKLVQKEIEFYESDYKLIETETSKMKNLKTLLLGEKIFSQNQMEKLGVKIQKYQEQSLDNHTWANCILWLSQAIEIQIFAIDIAKYLSLNDSGQSFKYSTTFTPTLQSWNDWKALHERLKSSKTQVTINGSRPPTSSILSTKSSKLLSRGTPRLSFSKDLINVKSGAILDEGISSGKSDALSVEGNVGRPLSGVSRPPSSLSKPSTSNSNSKGTASSRKSITPEFNLRIKSPSSALRRPVSNKDNLPPLPHKGTIQELVKPSSPKASFPCLENVFKTWIENARNDLLKSYEEYFVGIKDRDVRKKDLIALTKEESIKNWDEKLNRFLDSCDAFFEHEAIGLFNHTVTLSNGIERLINTIFLAVKEYSLDKLSTTWKSCMKDFLESRAHLQTEKTECLKSLKTSLGHPTMVADLYSLNEKAKNSILKTIELVDQTREKILNQFEIVTNDFLARILFLCTFIGDIGFNWNFQSRLPANSSHTVPTFETIDISMIPFDNILQLYKDFKIPSPSPDFKKTNVFIYVRTNVLTSFSDRLCNMLELLDQHCQTERDSEQKWKIEWTEKVQRIRAAF